MDELTRKDVIETLGDLDDVTVAAILRAGVSVQELAEAHAWLSNDEALVNTGRPLPSGRVAALVEIVTAAEEEKLLYE